MRQLIIAFVLAVMVQVVPLPAVAQDAPKKDLKTITKAAELGHPEAQYQLGTMYEHGEGGAGVHEVTAVLWYTQAAERGHARAQEEMGTRYLTGQGVTTDIKKAEEFLTLSAEQGYARGQYRLAQLYSRGARGVRKDHKKAIDWYTKAARQGYAPAQYYLGGMYAMGRGVEVDRIEAYAWLALAASQKYPKAIKSIESLGNALNELEVTKGQALAKSYYKKYIEVSEEE